MFAIIRTRYRLHKITAMDVWAYVDMEPQQLTEEEAIRICGPRPTAD